MSKIDLRLKEIISEILELSLDKITSNMTLLGDSAEIKSRELVEILLEIEDFMEDDYSVEFDWASDSAMSDANSNYKTVETLTKYLESLI